MWSYYGAKTKVINHYPPPKFGKIIEPFAGTARYSLKYFDRDVTIVDKYDVIINIWKWLQNATIDDINKLPHHLTMNQTLNDFKFDCKEAKMLMGFLIAKGVERPRNKPTARAVLDRPNNINFTLNKIKKDLHKIRNWKIIHGSYEDILNQEATWFIDPPYQVGGGSYVENKINFLELGEWCKNRQGQCLVCENTNADWLPFKRIIEQKGTHKITTEVIWSNLPTAFDNEQLKMKI